MKHKMKANPFLRIFVFAVVLAIVLSALAIIIFYYIFAIPEPEGLSLASWPYRFTDNFSIWMKEEHGNLVIEDIGIDRLDEYQLWLQVLDENGKEIFSHNKPPDYPASYSASELAALGTSNYENGNTVFVSSYENSARKWSYLIGFPYDIGKHMLYYNGENVGRLGPVFRIAVGIAFVLLASSVFLYGFWLTGHLAKISKGIDDISNRSYAKLPEKGVFRGVYRELNQMDNKIHISDELQENTERTRREWISNITHDLKTPLSPIKGYAELLSLGSVPDSEIVREYGQIILKNANHAQRLMNELKLTYQLEAGVMPFRPQNISFIRFVRETVIDIVNDPAFLSRSIEFESSIEELSICVDADLLRRALGNLIVNALTHNPPETSITVSVNTDKTMQVTVIVRDNGSGMSEEQQSEVFNRYYRGTNTKEKPEGSGLGLAIAKQIVMLHGGEISVKSKQGEGTQFIVSLPYVN